MKQYLDLCRFVLENGEKKSDRTGTGTISWFGYQSRYNLKNEFPLVTTKKIHFKSALVELLWFVKGDTNIQYLVKNGVRIWNEWPFKKYQSAPEYDGIDIKTFAQRIVEDNDFAQKWGDLGPVYGKQWRDFNGIDQLNWVIEEIKKNPQSRRLIISAWNPVEVNNMLLPPCHSLMQFYVTDDGHLNCQLYQRSGDIFLGIPFNIASYSLLTYMIASVTGLKPGTFIHVIGDAHIYLNHIDQINLQLTRTPYKLPKLIIKREVKNIEDFNIDDFELEGYEAHPHIPGVVAV